MRTRAFAAATAASLGLLLGASLANAQTDCRSRIVNGIEMIPVACVDPIQIRQTPRTARAVEASEPPADDPPVRIIYGTGRPPAHHVPAEIVTGSIGPASERQRGVNVVYGRVEPSRARPAVPPVPVVNVTRAPDFSVGQPPAYYQGQPSVGQPPPPYIYGRALSSSSRPAAFVVQQHDGHGRLSPRMIGVPVPVIIR